MKINLTSSRERATREDGSEGGDENLHGREGDGTQSYVTKPKELHHGLTCGSIYK